jgi:ABC-type glucose/galactose transport system permease subunit
MPPPGSEVPVSETQTGVAVLVGLCLAASVVLHLRVRRFGRACAVSALVAATVFVAADAMRSGYVDPFLPIAWGAAVLCGLAVSALVGLAVRAVTGRGRGEGPAGRPR